MHLHEKILKVYAIKYLYKNGMQVNKIRVVDTLERVYKSTIP